MDIKKILVLLLFLVAIVGIISPIDAVGTSEYFFDFKVKGKKIECYVDYGVNEKTNKVNKNEMELCYIGVSEGGDYNKNFLLKKTKKNEIKAYTFKYSEGLYGPKKTSLNHFKTYNTNLKVNNFYLKTFKAVSTKQVKTEANKKFK